jgi:glutamate-ammonia-ligase adenylyltransferase
VLRAIIDADREKVRDVLFVRERNGLPVSSPSRREELILAATLIKQFAHWLPATSDPHAALRRFRELVRRLRPDSDGLASLAWLQQPGVLPEIARVLGISQYLWETFLHSPPDQLPGLLATAGKPAGRVPRPTLEAELRRRLESAVTASEQWTVLNQFKDSHLFRIDVRNVTGRCRPFGAFSEELTELADVVVSAAVRIACDQLIAELGRPLRASDGQPCEWCACGLGKYGGMEMGFASDIELMLVYDEAGRTDARQPVSNALFFDRVVSQVAGGMITPQDGIFHIDLRMRPFGQAGIGAVSLADFVRYYEPGGPAWPFERQSLTRLRFVAGSRTLEAGIQAAVTASIFSGRAFDFPAMRAMRDRQLRQLVRGGTTNAKLSDGGIVDCEYAVQALQMSFGHQVPALRQPNTLNALRAAADYGLIDTKSEARVRAAYIFLRQVIDCLRLVRGNARDLTIPPAGSLDFRQLDLRLKMIHGSAIALDRVEQQLFEIRRFASDVERMCGGD